MTLDAYLKARGESESEFAERAGIGRATVFRIKKHGARSSPVIRKIVAACEGKVTANDLVGLSVKRKRSAA